METKKSAEKAPMSWELIRVAMRAKVEAAKIKKESAMVNIMAVFMLRGECASMFFLANGSNFLSRLQMFTIANR